MSKTLYLTRAIPRILYNNCRGLHLKGEGPPAPVLCPAGLARRSGGDWPGLKTLAVTGWPNPAYLPQRQISRHKVPTGQASTHCGRRATRDRVPDQPGLRYPMKGPQVPAQVPGRVSTRGGAGLPWGGGRSPRIATLPQPSPREHHPHASAWR